ncbi:hypothetical protein FACS1894204_01550 [Synergistales bacterium]|nr:hypothetical protein FACS1894204_01550 [Synergistales bacterium]
MSIYLAVFGKPRYLGFVNIDEPAQKSGKWIVIKTLRGTEMGLLGGALSEAQEAAYRVASLNDVNDEHTKGPEPMLQEVEFVQVANDENLKEYSELRADEEGVLVRSRRILSDHKLNMKLVDVEYTMNRKKLFFYFTAEQRIDFRAYVRDLAREFHIRIEMRQIGVRDESKTVCGISTCGRPCCCSQWLHSFAPINIRMVKEQNLVLNPTKISGICGRLMCCMAYEHPTYNALWKSLPSPGSKLKTPQGNYVLEGVNLKNESIRVRPPEGPEIDVIISEFADFKDAVTRGEQWKEKPVAAPRQVSPPRLPASARIPSRDGKLKPEKISLEEHIANREHEAHTESSGAGAVGVRGSSVKRGKKRGAAPDEAKHLRPKPAPDRIPVVRKASVQHGDFIDLEDSMAKPQEKVAKHKSGRRRTYPKTNKSE